MSAEESVSSFFFQSAKKLRHKSIFGRFTKHIRTELLKGKAFLLFPVKDLFNLSNNSRDTGPTHVL